MPPGSPCGVVTYYKQLLNYFVSDCEMSIQLVTFDDASWFERKASGFVRRLISLVSFNNKKIIKLSFDINFQLLIYFALRRNKRKGYHLIHAQDILTGYAAKRFYKGKLPLILTCHFNDNPVEEDVLRYGVRDTRYLADIYRRKFKEVDKFIFVSNYAYEKSKFLLNSSSDVEVIYNGVDFAVHEHRDDTNDILQIVNVGSVEERKNQKMLIPIAKKLLNENISNFHITIVGDGPDLPFLKSAISDSGLEKYFTFPGWISDVHQYLRKSNLYIHTAKNDNCPYSVIEAISKQVPVIAFSVGGIPEIVSQKFLFQLDDYNSMVNFIKQNLSSLPNIAKQQHDKIVETFSVEHQIAYTKVAYLSSIRDRGRFLSDCKFNDRTCLPYQATAPIDLSKENIQP